MNKNIIKIASGVILSLSLIACSEKDPVLADVHDIDYYVKNKDERIKIIEACGSNPGLYQNAPNCINAFKADVRDMPKDWLNRY